MKPMFAKSCLLILTLLALVCSAIGVTPAYAASYTVTNLNDNGGGSLRQAITNANASVGVPDTITFGVSGTITLASELPAVTDPAGLTIDATGQSITISGNDLVPVLSLVAGAALAIVHLTITHGMGGDRAGGGIMSLGMLNVKNSTFSDNHVATNGTPGGAIYSGGNLNVTDSAFLLNSTSGNFGHGGAIYVDGGGGAIIRNSSFSSNSANGTNSFGGALGLATGNSLVVTSSFFVANTAFDGGGIGDSGGTIAITGSTFSANGAANVGGGIYDAGALTFINSTMIGNTAAYAGGIYQNSGSGTSLTVANSDFTNNTAHANATAGAAIYNVGTGTIGNTIIAHSNVADSCGGVPLTNGGHNIDDGTSCGWGSALGSMSLTDPLFGSPAGSPPYLPLDAASPALNAGDDALCSNLPVNHQSQNGLTRPQGAHCDIGSYEAIVYYNLNVRSSAAPDGWVLETSELSNAGGPVNATAKTFNLGDDAANRQYRGILSFSTGAALPDTAVVTGVTLKVRKSVVTGAGNPLTLFKGFMVDVRKGFFGTSPALQSGDFQAPPSRTFGPFSPALVGGWYSLPLTMAGAKINKLSTAGGWTQIRLRFKLDDNNNAVANTLALFSADAPVASRPQLVITYYVP